MPDFFNTTMTVKPAKMLILTKTSIWLIFDIGVYSENKPRYIKLSGHCNAEKRAAPIYAQICPICILPTFLIFLGR